MTSEGVVPFDKGWNSLSANWLSAGWLNAAKAGLVIAIAPKTAARARATTTAKPIIGVNPFAIKPLLKIGLG